MNDHRTLPPHPSSIRTARRFVSQALSAAGTAADTVGTAELVVSELVTNAITHTGGAFTVSVDRSGGRVRVEVEDSGAGEPTLRNSGPDSADGRGLVIVAALCSDWGVERRGDHKTVWCELGAESELTGRA